MRLNSLDSLKGLAAFGVLLLLTVFPTGVLAETNLTGIDMTTTVTKQDGSKQTFEGSGLNDPYSSGAVAEEGGASGASQKASGEENQQEDEEQVNSPWHDKDEKPADKEDEDTSEYTGMYNNRSIIPEKMAVYCKLDAEKDIVKNESGDKINECLSKYLYEMSKANAEERKDAEKEYSDTNYKMSVDSLAVAIAKNGSVANFEEEMNKYSDAHDKQTSSADDEVAITHEIALATDVLNSLSELLTEDLKSSVFKNLSNIDPKMVVREDNPYKEGEEKENASASTFSGVYNNNKIIPQEMADYCELNAETFMEADNLEELYNCVKKYVVDLNNKNAEHKLAAEQDFSRLRYNMMVDQMEVAINNSISLANYEDTMNSHGEANTKQGTVMDNEVGLSEQLTFMTDVINRVRKLKLAQLQQYAIEGIKSIDPSIAAADEKEEEEKEESQDSTEVEIKGVTSETKSVSEVGELDNSEGEMGE